MTRIQAIGCMVALSVVALAIAAQPAFVGSVANGDTARDGFATVDLATSEAFGIRLLEQKLALPTLGPQTPLAQSKNPRTERFTIADISMDGEVVTRQVRDARFDWPDNLDPSGAPIELRQRHLAPLVRVSF